MSKEEANEIINVALKAIGAEGGVLIIDRGESVSAHKIGVNTVRAMGLTSIGGYLFMKETEVVIPQKAKDE